MPKKMYVIQADDGMFYCGMRYWDKQLRKAKIYHSLVFAEDITKAYEECNCKIREVSLAIVPETKTNADRIRAMTDEELAEDFCRILVRTMEELGVEPTGSLEDAVRVRLKWLQQPAEGE